MASCQATLRKFHPFGQEKSGEMMCWARGFDDSLVSPTTVCYPTQAYMPRVCKANTGGMFGNMHAREVCVLPCAWVLWIGYIVTIFNILAGISAHVAYVGEALGDKTTSAVKHSRFARQTTPLIQNLIRK